MPKAKITKSFVDSTPFTEKGQKTYCDTELPGFYVVVGMRSKTYIVQKDMHGKSVRCTIGRHGHFTPEEARRIAKDKLYMMANGANPNEEKKEERSKIITLRLALKSYQETRKNLSEKTKQDYEYHVNKYLKDWLDILMVDIDKDMIVKRHTQIGEKHGPFVSNGTMRILRALFNHAHAIFDTQEINPVSYLSKTKAWYPEKRRRSYIKPHQLKTWWSGVQSLESDTMRDFLTFLLFTGLRRGEASSLRWSDIDFRDKTFSIEKTKNGDPLVLPMSDFLYEMMERRRRRHGNGIYVFPGPGKNGFLAEPKKAVYKVIQRTGILFTCHDLRRTFVTLAESLDLPYYALKQLMNHKASDVTSGYIVIDAERLRGPVQKIEVCILNHVGIRTENSRSN